MLKQTTDYFKLVDWRRLKLKQYLIVFYTKKGRKSKKTNETLTRLKSNCCVFRPTFRCCAHPKAGFIWESVTCILDVTRRVNEKQRKRKFLKMAQKSILTRFWEHIVPESWSKYVTNSCSWLTNAVYFWPLHLHVRPYMVALW